MKLKLVKRESGSKMLLIIMISAVGSLLGTRLFLELTGYPEISNEKWHVAHVLWGGLAMVAGMILTLVFHGEKTRKKASIIFGVGLGWFIDEIGKFLSHDNDYFFQPAIVFMYVFFILMFLLYRYFEKIQTKDVKSLLYQIINGLEEIAERDFENREKKEILEKLGELERKTSGKINNLSIALRKMIVELPSKKNKKIRSSNLLWKKLKFFGYHKIFKRKTITSLLLLLSAGYILEGLFSTVGIFLHFDPGEAVNIYKNTFMFSKTHGLMLTMKIFSDTLIAGMFVAGLVLIWRKQKREGLGFFQRGLLVSIFLSSIFRFYFEQFSAVFGLIFNIIIWIGLDRMERDIKD
ncbi:hypothetical protein KKA02_03480 [Patescibacteria group bacterium]|nr:hypothetical protein [Patescibacteria group bacterium]